MAGVQLILSTDTLETGFRLKANSSFNSIIVSATPVVASGLFTGVIRLNTFGGGFINLDLSSLYYTQTQISTLIGEITGSSYRGAWSNSFSGGYSSTDVVDYSGTFWRSATNSNTDQPGTTLNWTDILTHGNLVLPLITIPATTGIPKVIDMTAHAAYGARPKVWCSILKAIDGGAPDDTIEVPQPLMGVERKYTDNTRTVLKEIHIYGNNNGSGQFNEDTFITIEQ